MTGWGEEIKLHLGASLITGLVTTTVTAPLDMIKTNMYASGDYGIVEMTNKIYIPVGKIFRKSLSKG